MLGESASRACHALLRQDAECLVAMLTPLEILSALSRRRREGALSPESFIKARGDLAALQQEWRIISLTEAILDRGRLLLEHHPLRTADALQLASALVAFQFDPRGIPFVTLDGRLATAAAREGFEVLTPN